MIGKACGGKPGRQGSKGDTAESHAGGGAITVASLLRQPASAAEQ